MPEVNKQQLTDELLALVAPLLHDETDGLSMHITFANYGMNSMKMILLLTQVENRYQFSFSEEDLVAFPELTIARFANRVYAKLT